MTDSHQKKLDVRQIIGRVRQKAAGNAEGSNCDGDGIEDKPAGILPPYFQGKSLDVDRNAFDLHELLESHDLTFIIQAYQVLLKRDPDPDGLHHYLDLLRSGRMDKVRILASFRFGTEGRKQKVRVRGLGWETFKLLLKAPPLLGGVMDYLLALFGLCRIKTDLARNDVELGRLFEETGQALARLEAKIESRLDAKADKHQLAQKVNLQEMNQYLRSVNQVFDIVCTLREAGSADMPKQGTPPHADPYSGERLDDLYLSFEDAFRGPRELIRKRLEIYLPEIRKATGCAAVLAPSRHIPVGCKVLDLGCGRGEFLELLAQNNIQAMGIDASAVMVQQGRDSGLDIRERDIFEFLAALPAQCLNAVTAFQVLEHLPFPLQLMLIDQCRRILAPQGLLILETPNPQNILAGSVDFHRDPTHLRPVHPDTLLFLVRARGFVDARIGLPSLIEGVGVLQDASDIRFADFSDYLTVARDYALLAYKP